MAYLSNLSFQKVGSRNRLLCHLVLNDLDHGLRTHDSLIPNSLGRKFKSQYQRQIWDLGIKA